MMHSWIKQFIAPPVFEDKDKTRTASVLNAILLVTLTLSVAYGVISLFIYVNPGPILLFVGTVVLLGAITLALIQRGQVQLASVFLSFVLWGIVTLGVFVFGGVRGPSFSGYFMVIFIASLLLGGRAGVAFTGLSVLAGLGILYAEISGVLPPSFVGITATSTWALATTILILTAVLLHLATRTLKDTLMRAHRNEHALGQMVDELRRTTVSKAYVDNIIRSMADTLVVVNPDATIQTFNEATSKLLGYKDYELIGQPVGKILTQEVLFEGAGLDGFIQKGFISSVETAYVARDGTSIPISFSASVMHGEHGEIQGIVCVAQDISERKRAEQALKALNESLEQRVAERTAELESLAAELARSNQELEHFASVASHDLQEPLRKIHAFSELLAAKYGDSLNDQGHDYLERMQSATIRMQTLIDSLLTYSRVTTRAEPFAPTDLNQIACEVLSDLETRIEEVSGQVEVNNLPTIEADPTQMRQLLQNLIGNALKYHREDEAPVVQISAKRLEGQPKHLAGNPPGDGLCQIVVQDNGIGFDEKYLNRIFQAFQRLHGQDEYEGSGVGLATCRKIVERHGGSITAESTPGQGATFIVTLPVKQRNGNGDVQ